MYTIYLISNSVNTMKYVGITSMKLFDRWKAHISSTKHLDVYTNPMYKDMVTFGLDKFSIDILEFNIPYEFRNIKEQEYIALYNTYYPNGYNLTRGGFNNYEVVWPDDRGQKISKALKGKPKSDLHKKHISDARKGKFCKSENPFYQKHHTDATKSRISKANSKYKIEMLDKDTMEVVHTFDNSIKAGEFIVSTYNLTSNKLTCSGRIRYLCHNCMVSNIAYGFHWRYKKV